MKTKKLSLYTVSMKYIRDLTKVDDHVLSVSPQIGKSQRPFVGIVLICNERKYCIPLSSPKPKHLKMKNRIDFSKIYSRDGKLIGVLNFNNMIPVEDEVIARIDLHPSDNADAGERKYKELLKNQLSWCNDHHDQIIQKANKLHELIVNGSEENHLLKQRCCDFVKLEQCLASKSRDRLMEYHRQMTAHLDR